MNRTLEAAVALLSDGHFVVPVGRDKAPLVHWKRLALEPLTTVTLERIYTAFPDAGVGLVTGLAFDVVDIEREGMAVLGRELQSHDGPRTRTGGGGVHLFVARSELRSGPLRLLGRRIGDYKGPGGYVIVPPSSSRKGAYEWEVPLDATAMFPPAARWVEEARARPSAPRPGGGRQVEDRSLRNRSVAAPNESHPYALQAFACALAMPRGTFSERLFHAACSLLACGISLDECFDACLDEAVAERAARPLSAWRHGDETGWVERTVVAAEQRLDEFVPLAVVTSVARMPPAVQLRIAEGMWRGRLVWAAATKAAPCTPAVPGTWVRVALARGRAGLRASRLFPVPDQETT